MEFYLSPKPSAHHFIKIKTHCILVDNVIKHFKLVDNMIKHCILIDNVIKHFILVDNVIKYCILVVEINRFWDKEARVCLFSFIGMSMLGSG